MIFGTVTAFDSDGVQLLLDGENEPTTHKYKHLSSYSPTINDRVGVEKTGDSYVVLGKIV